MGQGIFISEKNEIDSGLINYATPFLMRIASILFEETNV